MAVSTEDNVKSGAAQALEAARRRSLELLAPLDDTALTRQHSPLMSPLVWDLAHVGNYEDLWLVRAAGARAGVEPALDDIYDAFRHVRADRPRLPLLGPLEARRYISRVRDHALDVLERLELDPAVPLMAGAFVVGLVVQHEHQHDETMLATLQLMGGAGYRAVAPPPPQPTAGGTPGAQVWVPDGAFEMGTDDVAWAYDNERPCHAVELRGFWIDRWPVTNAQYQAFMADGGYRRRELWHPAGWSFREEAALEAPQFWHRQGPGSWTRDRFGWVEDVPPDEPVQHVCWYEADAYARWAGRRLPTEQEWEKAARWSPSSGGARQYPWGDGAPGLERANLGGRHFRPAAVGAYPAGAAACGAEQLIGDVWEWTSSDFGPYPGFASFPYREYSEVFFGPRYKVLRGGSWATDGAAVRATFRNWDYPIRRQIFAGFRCARDA
ncbi:MAG TPA: ergothioneine biosynthesis protein EgtB [Acidimicrobiales bacterium]|jgi:iron(II)-dependent oxidoreductase|nr:ergothioneine biosynthesis protein EgtB [Acidimicrobiales bacterium]